jgi:hypothetical protein
MEGIDFQGCYGAEARFARVASTWSGVLTRMIWEVWLKEFSIKFQNAPTSTYYF